MSSFKNTTAALCTYGITHQNGKDLSTYAIPILLAQYVDSRHQHLKIQQEAKAASEQPYNLLAGLTTHPEGKTSNKEATEAS
ncbi:hypothetical protein [Saccharospirillum sp.]|uniref:hypothetical protein n=1 Tax=Saccharospirillum sp. TaxID=2033801 RepID=UPI0034A0A2C5